MGSPGGDQEAGSTMDQDGQRTKCGGDERAEHAKGGRNHRVSRKPDVASTPGLSDSTAIGTITSVGTSVYGRSTVNRHQTKADTGTGIFSNPDEGPTVVDTSSPTITTIVKGKEIAGTIIDGGSGVNVISR